ncbi:unnamed protein product, partial [Ectocarpus fasciculatus]
GVRVEARYKGGSAWLPGVISKVRLSGKVIDVEYDDGRAESGMRIDNIRIIDDRRGATESKESNEPILLKYDVPDSHGSAGDYSNLPIGSKVQAYYRGGTRLYPGVISRVRLNGTYDIDYDDGEKEAGVKKDLIQSAGPSSTSTLPSQRMDPNLGDIDDDTPLKVGSTVRAYYRGGTRLYPGVISRARLNGTYDIDYDDGEKEAAVKKDLIQSAG